MLRQSSTSLREELPGDQQRNNGGRKNHYPTQGQNGEFGRDNDLSEIFFKADDSVFLPLLFLASTHPHVCHQASSNSGLVCTSLEKTIIHGLCLHKG